jgi:hypothetical protein
METIKIKNLEFTDYNLKEIEIKGNFRKDVLNDDEVFKIKEEMQKMHYKECFLEIKKKIEKAEKVIISFMDNFDEIEHEVFPACREAIKSLNPEKVIVETPFVTLEWKNGNVEYKLYDADFTQYFAYDTKMELCFSDFSDLVCSSKEEFEEMVENQVSQIKEKLKKFELTK